MSQTPTDPATQLPPSDLPDGAVPDEIRHEWVSLAEQARAHQFAYHVKDSPTISDGEYDALIRTLTALEDEHPAGSLEHLGHRRQRRPLHRREGTPVEVEPGERLDDVRLPHEDGDAVRLGPRHDRHRPARGPHQ